MVTLSDLRWNVFAGPPIVACFLPLRGAKLIMSMRSAGGQPAWLTTVQMSEVQKVVPYSKLGSARSCASPVVLSRESIREKRRRFGVPTPIAPRTSRVACDTTVCETVAGEAVGYFSRMRAATPATNGADSDVPLETLVAVELLYVSERMFVPGANRSTQLP